MFEHLNNVNATFVTITMNLFSNNTDRIYMLGHISLSNITQVWNLTFIGPMGVVGTMTTAKTDMNVWSTSIYGTRLINCPYYSGNTGAFESITGPQKINISNFTNSNNTMNGTGIGLFIGAVASAEINAYNITNNASFGYNRASSNTRA